MSEKKYTLSYGRGSLEFHLEQSNVRQVMMPNSLPVLEDAVEAIKQAINNPIASRPLKDIVKTHENIVIIVNDITRLTRSDVFLPIIVDELNEAGIKDENIKIVFAQGTHLSQTAEEHELIVGKKLAQRITMIDHDCTDDANHVYVGTTSRGNEILVNKHVVEADRVILTGGIILHLLAGYGGGRKAILPGVCHKTTIDNNHKFMFDPMSADGVLEGNPCHEDMVEACAFINPDFLVNAILNENKEFVGVVAGHWKEAHKAGCQIVDQLYKVKLLEQVDVVIASCGGFPKDIDFRQAHKGQENAYKALKPGGMLVLAAQCPNEHGDASFYEYMLKYDSHEKMEKELEKDFLVGPHKAFWVAKLSSIAPTYLISDMPDEMVRNLKMIPVRSIEEAMEKAYAAFGGNLSICIMPYASYTLPTI